MSRFAKHLGMVALALVANVPTFTLLIYTLRWRIETVGFLVYFLLPLALLIWSIAAYRRRRAALFLTFAITMMVSAVAYIGFFMIMILIALRSFT